MKDVEIAYNNFKIIWKSYQVLRDGLKVSNEEIDELIQYYTLMEEYEICDKLNKLKT